MNNVDLVLGDHTKSTRFPFLRQAVWLLLLKSCSKSPQLGLKLLSSQTLKSLTTIT